MTVEIEKIVVSDRIRQSVGDLQELAESINRVGLLNPILIDAENRLVAGLRRLEACKLLGWSEIEAKVIELDGDAIKSLNIELEENKGRLELAQPDIEAYHAKKEELLAPPPKPNPIISFLKKLWNSILSLFKRKNEDDNAGEQE